MVFSWCFGLSLQIGVQIVSWSDTIVEILGIVFNALSLVPHVKLLNCRNDHYYNANYFKYESGHKNEGCHQLHPDQVPREIGILTLSSAGLLIHLIEFIVLGVLFRGAQERNAPKCRLWTWLTGILTGLDFLIFVGHMVLEQDDLLISYVVPNVLYKVYSMVVVQAFAAETEDGGEAAPVLGPKVSLMEYSQRSGSTGRVDAGP